MNKPDPNASRIREIFSQTFSNARKPDELEQLKYVGPLLFNESEVYATTSILDRLLRRFCVDNHISEEYFSEKFKIYSLESLGHDPTQASNNRSNLVKAMKAGNITFKVFIKALTNVLGYQFSKLIATVHDEDGQVQNLVFEEPQAFENRTVEFKPDSVTTHKEGI